MTTYSLLPLAGAGWQFLDDNGRILQNGRLYTYLAGGTTPAQTWQDYQGNASNGVYVQLDPTGRPPAEVWGDSEKTYKIEVRNEDAVPIRTYDHVPCMASAAQFSGAGAAGAIGFSWQASYTAISVGSALQSTIQTVASIADLRLNDSDGFDVSVFVLGYYAPGDFGGGLFEYDVNEVGADNDGTIIVDGAGRRWVRYLPDGSICPQMFGAKCDTATDDTLAVQAMFDAADRPEGNLIRLIAGECQITDTIFIRHACSVVGYGAAETASGTPYAGFVSNFASGDVFQVVTSQACHFANFGIRAATTRTSGFDILVVGDGTLQPVGFTFHGLQLNGCQSGLGAYNGRQFAFTQNYILNYGYNGTGVGIYYPSTNFTDSGDNVIDGNWFQSNVSGLAGFAFAAVQLEKTFAVAITSNKFFGAKYGIQCFVKDTSANLLVQANSFEQQETRHIDIQQSVAGKQIGNIIITGNEFSQLNSGVSPTVNPSTPSIYVQAGAAAYVVNMVLSNNVFNHSYTTNASAVALEDGTGVIAQGNIFNLFSNAQPFSFQTGGNATNVKLLDNIFNNQTTAQRYKTLNSSTLVRDFGLAFADLGSWANGSEIYVTDGTAGSPLTGGGTGSQGFRINGAWKGI